MAKPVCRVKLVASPFRGRSCLTQVPRQRAVQALHPILLPHLMLSTASSPNWDWTHQSTESTAESILQPHLSGWEPSQLSYPAVSASDPPLRFRAQRDASPKKRPPRYIKQNPAELKGEIMGTLTLHSIDNGQIIPRES
ncbi:unnamed protein product [Rangifer tarandus platyrhynchus]|uniref:Uncharacterized protein n=2 Tax=Rangifer tarandus platyrhynchus TaxID=3082113 RepID=A0AC59ZNG4_RANTA|nr:unnamed protein product [Rangifer tarandus platyrhynchus]